MGNYKQNRKRRCSSGLQKNHEENPYTGVVYRNTMKLIGDFSEEEVIENLKKLDYELEPHIYKALLVRSTFNVIKFIKLMIATDHNTFTFTITDEEKKLLLDFVKKGEKEGF